MRGEKTEWRVTQARKSLPTVTACSGRMHQNVVAGRRLESGGGRPRADALKRAPGGAARKSPALGASGSVPCGKKTSVSPGTPQAT